MKVEIVAINKAGKANEEYIALKVLEDCNLKYYMIADTTYVNESAISNKVRHTYWFASCDVKKGDFVWLFSGKGEDTKRGNSTNTTTHLRFWGLGGAVWNNEGDCGVLYELNSWTTKKA